MGGWNKGKLLKSERVKAAVLLAHAEGKSNARIARELKLDWHTVAKILKAQEITSITSIPEAMERHGLTADSLARGLAELKEAKETKVFSYEGQLVYSKPLVAWSSRKEALDMSFKLLGAYPQTGSGVNININIPGKELEHARLIAARIRDIDAEDESVYGNDSGSVKAN